MMSNIETLSRLSRTQTAQSPPDGVISDGVISDGVIFIFTDQAAMAQKLVIG